MSEGDTAGTMIKLNATNYSIWKIRMEDLLVCKDLYDPIEGDGIKPVGKSEEEWKKINEKTIDMIRQWIDKSIYRHVSSETNAHNLWKKLSNLFECKSAQNKAFLIRKLVNFNYKDGSSIAEHIGNFQNVVNQLNTMEIVFDDELLALLLLSSLPDSWEILVISLSNSAPNGKLDFSMVKGSLLDEETRRKGLGLASSWTQNNALDFESRGRSQRRNFQRSENRSKSRGKSKFKKDIQCFHCNKMGHTKRECRFLKQQK